MSKGGFPYYTVCQDYIKSIKSIFIVIKEASVVL